MIPELLGLGNVVSEGEMRRRNDNSAASDSFVLLSSYEINNDYTKYSKAIYQYPYVDESVI
jgi:hypothetical protein